MDNNRRYSFFQLFTKGNDYEIVIPIIQRDYAQGRDNVKAQEVRDDFLEQLFNYMTAEGGSHDLDFVYGMSDVCKDNSKKKEFIPLDGQQRLTTLFLIHFYLAIRSKGSEESNTFFKTMQIKNGRLTKSLFTYRTRTSAVEFCNCLIDIDNDFSEVFNLGEKQERLYKNKLSDYIRNSSWYYPDWSHDPTVDGMLRMLDAIDSKFDGCHYRDVLRRLISDDEPSVSFIFMDLDNYKLTDDLYIKMNSRGKPLTSFENFKAKYEQFISCEEKGKVVNKEEIQKESGKYEYINTPDGGIIRISQSIYRLKEEIEGKNNPVIKTIKDYFAFNIDTKWSQLFWKYCKKEIIQREEEIKSKKTVSIDRLLSDTLDLKISRFIKSALTSQYAIEHLSSDSSSIPGILTDDSLLSFAGLKNVDAVSADGIVMTTLLFDLHCDRPIEIMPSWAHCFYDESGIFESMVMGQDFSFTKRLLQYAYSMFRLKFGDDKIASLVEWMRFMYNMTADGNAVQAITGDTYFRAVESINVLLDLLDSEEPSIQTLLSSNRAPKEIKFFPENQYKEEILKSYLIRKESQSVLRIYETLNNGLYPNDTDSWGTIIVKFESHPYFTGQIGFILKMAGIADYYDINNNLEWDEYSNVRFKKEFIKYGKIASAIFEGGYENRKYADDAIFERAMLTKYSEYHNCHFLNSKLKRAYSNNLLRDFSWKRYLRLYKDYNDIQIKIKDLFDLLDIDNPIESLKSIILSECEGIQWRKDIIKYDYLMKYGKFGFYAMSEDKHLILKYGINYSMWDIEVYSYVLYSEYLTQKGSISNIGDFHVTYGYSNSNQEVPYVKLERGEVVIKIKSKVDENDGQLLNHYLIIDSNGESDLEKFLENQGFKRKDDTDTIFRREEKMWEQRAAVNDYRTCVTEHINNFLCDLSSFLRIRAN